MWTSAVLALVVSQTGAVKVAAPPFTLVGLDSKLGAVFQDRFVSRLSSPELRVTTSRDIEQLLGLERQRQLLGCDANSQCLAELAGALGVDAVVSGNIAKSESGFIASLRALRTADGQLIDSPSTRVATEGELLDWLDSTSERLRGKLLEHFRPGSTGTTVVRWIPGIIGGAMIIAGTVCLSVSAAAYGQLVGPTPLMDISGTRARGEVLLPIGLALVGVGAAGILSSALWSITASPVKVAWMPLRDGHFFALTGVFP